MYRLNLETNQQDKLITRYDTNIYFKPVTDKLFTGGDGVNLLYAYNDVNNIDVDLTKYKLKIVTGNPLFSENNKAYFGYLIELDEVDLSDQYQLYVSGFSVDNNIYSNIDLNKYINSKFNDRKYPRICWNNINNIESDLIDKLYNTDEFVMEPLLNDNILLVAEKPNQEYINRYIDYKMLNYEDVSELVYNYVLQFKLTPSLYSKYITNEMVSIQWYLTFNDESVLYNIHSDSAKVSFNYHTNSNTYTNFNDDYYLCKNMNLLNINSPQQKDRIRTNKAIYYYTSNIKYDSELEERLYNNVDDIATMIRYTHDFAPQRINDLYELLLHFSNNIDDYKLFLYSFKTSMTTIDNRLINKLIELNSLDILIDYNLLPLSYFFIYINNPEYVYKFYDNTKLYHDMCIDKLLSYSSNDNNDLKWSYLWGKNFDDIDTLKFNLQQSSKYNFLVNSINYD
jgi:hypothetical protein